MNVYYNTKGVGDVLIIPLTGEQAPNFTEEKFGDVTKIMNENKNVIGYNIFNASKYLTLDKEGTILLTNDLLNEIKALFDQEGLDNNLEFDLIPNVFLVYEL